MTTHSPTDQSLAATTQGASAAPTAEKRSGSPHNKKPKVEAGAAEGTLLATISQDNPAQVSRAEHAPISSALAISARQERSEEEKTGLCC